MKILSAHLLRIRPRPTTPRYQLRPPMALPSPKLNMSLSTTLSHPEPPELTSTTAVHDYLHNLSDSHSNNTLPCSVTPFLNPRAIRRITLGSTNYTYRLFFPTDGGHNPHTNSATTAILKYASAYTSGEPRVRFDPARQVFEVRAMAEIPWTDIIPAQSQGQGQGVPQVKIPRVYFADPARRVIIMEDGTPRKRRGGTANVKLDGEIDSDDVWEERSHSSRIFLEDLPASPDKYATASVLGKTLGMFLARMHNWARGGRKGEEDESGATPWVRETFGRNTYARDLTIQEAIEDFWTGVRCCDIGGGEDGVLSGSRQEEVRERLEDMRKRILTDYETLVMGDFWSDPFSNLPPEAFTNFVSRLGNVLLTFRNIPSPFPTASKTIPPVSLETLSIIDWEFAMAGPAFLDVGNFIGEVFLINYFERNDEVYTRLLEAFIVEYKTHTPPQRLDIEMILSYAGAHIVQALPRRISSPRSRATRENARGCLEHAIGFILNTSKTTGASGGEQGGTTDETLQGLLGIMRGLSALEESG
ncbi:hypothetical protein BJY01DRAFT_246162 [Aspergillus pseudoustus]|uniref:Aminoglycoside phosphotransferase domain-containing protein n=1 Tax=Aspergillus pseudoustus TaxID=1810923 RepID=A0ABR4K9U1_9EURO